MKAGLYKHSHVTWHMASSPEQVRTYKSTNSMWLSESCSGKNYQAHSDMGSAARTSVDAGTRTKETRCEACFVSDLARIAGSLL